MNKLLPAALALALLAPTARAGNLTLGTTTPPGSPLTFMAGTQSVPVNVFAVNDVNPDAAANLMRGWQVSLAIVPDAGATGTLTFSLPVTGILTPPPPTNYVFGAGGFGIDVTNASATLMANDANTIAAGTQVPISPGANLLAVTFQASTTAGGTFGLFAVAGSANTAWTDATTPTPQTRFFVNVPSNAGPVRVGTISVTPVPEPTCCTLIAMTGLGAVAAGRRLARRFRRG